MQAMLICFVRSGKTIEINGMEISLWSLGKWIVLRLVGEKTGSLKMCGIFNVNVDSYTILTILF
jgi:hypothetical protein